MKTQIMFRIGAVAAIVLAIGIAFSWIAFTRVALAQAPSGLPASVYTESTTSLGTTVLQLAATTTNCASRVVSTSGSAIMLGFTAANGTTTSGSVGIWQAASTTVAYDSGLYGCSQLSGYSYATDPITLIITQD